MDEIKEKKVEGLKKKSLKGKKCLRWNYVDAPDNCEGKKRIRCFFDIVDNKFRQEKIKDILHTANSRSIINFNFEEAMMPLEGKIVGTEFRYLCKIYDINCTPKYIEEAISKLFGDASIRDKNLYERTKEGTSLEKYLWSIHGE